MRQSFIITLIGSSLAMIIAMSAHADPQAAAQAVQRVRTSGFDAYSEACVAGEDAVDGLLGIVRDKQASYEARATAINALGQIRTKKAVQPLMGQLKDSDQRIRRCAVIALGTIGDPAARLAITDLAKKDKFSWTDPQTGQLRYLVREDAKKALEMLSGRGAGGMASRAAPDSGPQLEQPKAETTCERLPWPHQPPSMSGAEVSRLVNGLWIINNFSLYQADDRGDFAYVHGGLDVVLENGTRIYAIKDGWVRSVAASTVAIADNKDDQPSYGWEYTHLGNVQVQPGQAVKRGTWIGDVQFEGLPHLHLTKVYSQGGKWGEWRYMCMPDGHFDYPDTQAPIIKSPFYFMPNDSNTQIRPDTKGNVILSGKVDVIVGMREQGEYAHSKDSGFGDRLGMGRIEWEVTPADRKAGNAHKYASFDFEHMLIKSGVYDRAFNSRLAGTLGKHWSLFEKQRPSGDKTFGYYVVTNCPQTGDTRELKAEWEDFAWDTASKDSSGRPEFPDGNYQITVRAWDLRSHKAEASMAVVIRNSPIPSK